MPINGNGEVWKRSNLSSGIEYSLTKEFFRSQSDLNTRDKEYKSSTWKARNDIDGKEMSWQNANSAEIKAVEVIKDKFNPILIRQIINKVHQSILPLNELVDAISRSCETFVKGEEVVMDYNGDIILSCRVLQVHDEAKSYTINDGTREVVQVPSTHLRRRHKLTPFEIESLIRLTCSQTSKDRPWLVDEPFKKEFGMKEKLAPIFCKPVNRTKNDASSEDEIAVIPSMKKKTKRGSNESLKENGEKKEKEKKKEEKGEEKKEEKRGRKRKEKEEDGEKKEKVEKKKAKKEKEVINLDSTDDEAPLSTLIEKMKEKKQKQGFLDKFLTASPSSSSSKSSPTKKRKGKVEKAMEPLVALYKGEDAKLFLSEVDKVIGGLKKEEMEGRMEVVATMDGGEDSGEMEVMKIGVWRKRFAEMHAASKKVAVEERAVLREANRKELDAHPGKIVYDKFKERIKTAKAVKEMEEEERGEDYDKSMPKLPPYGQVINSPHFPTALMISQFVYTRSHLFPSNYRLPMTEELIDCLSSSGEEREKKSKQVTYPLAKILLEKILSDDRFSKRFAFCEASVCKMKVDEHSVMELLRVLVTGEKYSTKAERDLVKEEMQKEEENGVKEEEDERAPSPDEEEDEEEGDISIVNEEERNELVASLDGGEGRWEKMDGKSQGILLEFILNCYLDSDGFEIKSDAEVQEERDELRKEKKELKGKIDELSAELKELKVRIEGREKMGLRNTRNDTGAVTELEEGLDSNNRRMDEINKLMKSLDKEVVMAAFASRVDPIGVDRHGRRYILMPHYAGLLIQSMGSGEWIKDEDGSDVFGFVPADEEWREVKSVKEWDELSEVLKNGSRNDKKLMKTMEKKKETFERGLKWAMEVEENKKKEENEEEEEEQSPLSGMEVAKKEMTSLLEKAENGEMMKVKDISTITKKLRDAKSFNDMKCLLEEYDEVFQRRAKEDRAIFKANKMVDEYSFHSLAMLKKRIRECTRLSELVMLMRVMEYRTTWNYKEADREKEAKKEKEKREEEKKKRGEEEEEENEWANRGVHTRRFVESGDKKAVRGMMKKVIELASGRLASTLNGLESEDERMMNMKDIEEECHRYSLERLKKVLRKNMERWRDEIESRFSHRLEQFDEFAEAVHKLLK